jgi:anti-sigma regulatory factor (Ser/Thr protein kinase)
LIPIDDFCSLDDRTRTNGARFDRVISVEAETARLGEIRRFVEEAASDARLDLERIFDCKVAVSEACANAIEHVGNNSLPLEVCARLEAARLTFIVTDNGPFRTLCPGREDARNRGLGMPLMVALMDEVSFTRARGGGTTVSLSVLVDRVATQPA